MINKNDLSAISEKINKTTRRRRRKDPFIRMNKFIYLFLINKF
jgi:hypothetical protein